MEHNQAAVGCGCEATAGGMVSLIFTENQQPIAQIELTANAIPQAKNDPLPEVRNAERQKD